MRLWREFVSPYRWRLALALALMAVFAASEGAIAILLERVLGMLRSGDPRAIYVAPAIVVGLGLINGAALYFQVVTTNHVALRVIVDMQNALFTRLTTLDLAQVSRDASGQIVSRFTNDVNFLRDALIRAPNGMARDSLRIIVLAGAMAYLDWALFLAVLLIYPLAAFPIGWAGRRVRRVSRESQAQMGDMTALLNESVSGARMVKSYSLEPHERKRSGASFTRRYELMMRIVNARAAVEPTVMIIGAAAVSLVFAVAAYRMSLGALTLEGFAAFITALIMVAQPARSLGTLNTVLQEGMAAAQRMFEFLDRRPEITDAADAEGLAVTAGEVVLSDVVFAYGEEPALAGVSLRAGKGAVVALVGPSGAGKSTIFNLIPRFYDVEKGRVLIDGQDVRNVSLASLRKAVALVSQDIVLFDATVGANIAFGAPGAAEADIHAAAEAAAADFVHTLPQGYDTAVGEHGATLSGGQRQRIAIARAILKNAPILLLDEATSALDSESEAKVQAALSELMKGRTTFVIAHRLATVRHADWIYVMDQGRVVEEGRHDALLAKGGLYARLCRLQFAEDKDEAGAPV